MRKATNERREDFMRLLAMSALARYRWRGARSGKSGQECQQARSGITVIAMSSFTAANPCRA
jgi:hypothetical protein